MLKVYEIQSLESINRNKAILICLHVVYRCFYSTVAELSSCDSTCMTHKA